MAFTSSLSIEQVTFDAEDSRYSTTTTATTNNHHQNGVDSSFESALVNFNSEFADREGGFNFGVKRPSSISSSSSSTISSLTSPQPQLSNHHQNGEIYLETLNNNNNNTRSNSQTPKHSPQSINLGS